MVDGLDCHAVSPRRLFLQSSCSQRHSCCKSGQVADLEAVVSTLAVGQHRWLIARRRRVARRSGARACPRSERSSRSAYDEDHYRRPIIDVAPRSSFFPVFNARHMSQVRHHNSWMLSLRSHRWRYVATPRRPGFRPHGRTCGHARSRTERDTRHLGRTKPASPIPLGWPRASPSRIAADSLGQGHSRRTFESRRTHLPPRMTARRPKRTSYPRQVRQLLAMPTSVAAAPSHAGQEALD